MNKKLTYYSLIGASVVATLLIFLYFFRTETHSTPSSLGEYVLFYSKLFWFTGVLVALTNVIGLLWFGNTDYKNKDNIRNLQKNGWNDKKKLVVVYVSRGDNHAALERSIVSTGKLLTRYGVNHRIDVVTDSEVEDKHSHSIPVVYHVVPGAYETQKGSRYKARALHYVVERHADEKLHHGEDTWVLHLDEESQLHESALAGISQFVNNPENRESVGQGEIKYNAFRYGKSWLITAIDSVRTGDDLGRFRFQYKVFGRPLFGMHGSYILLPGKLEQKYGFDLGGRGSITEDAYFAVKCASDGYSFRWVEGYVREQSPYSIRAVINQRRRWYCGLIYLAFDKSIAFPSRAILMLNMILWTVAWAGPLITVVNLIFGGYFPFVLTILAALIQGFYSSVYMVGLWRNVQDVEMSPVKKMLLFPFTFIFIPIANAIEGIAVLYGIVRPVKHFDIVNKN